MVSKNGSTDIEVLDIDITSDIEVVRIDPNHIRMSPLVMRKLTAATGRTMEQLMASDESADKFQAMAFIQLHRHHQNMSAEDLWELAGTTEVELAGPEPDPFGTEPSTLGQPSPTTGNSIPTP
jgi:hypothetical protein